MTAGNDRRRMILGECLRENDWDKRRKDEALWVRH